MRVAGFIEESIVDGPGVRFVVFAQGCPHECEGCHNQQTWDPQGGKDATVKEISRMIKKKVKNIRGVTLSGGEPFLQASEMVLLAHKVKEMGLDIVTYTGYTYEKLQNLGLPGVQELLNATDLLVDGPFLLEHRDIGLTFRGSTNQRVIDLVATRKTGQLTTIK